ncbi:MAG TPA: winged helix-turn-helix domain-containing protein [Xanthobacteraceae bacterium]
MTAKKSLLENLYTDSGGFDAERAAHVLKQILSIQRGSHAVFFKRDAALKEEDKVLAYMLVKKLLKNDGVSEDSGVSGKEIKKQTNIKPGTVDVAIKRLREDGLIAGSGSNYEIPADEVDAVVDRLETRAPKRG